jgi:[acyl-carrier-protein] S-malonyltransferase
MSSAANDFAVRLAQTDWRNAQLPVYLNITAGPETQAGRIAELMVSQLISPVRWYDIMVNMLADGFDTFVEVGPKNVLSGLVKKHLGGRDDIRVFNVDGPESLEKLKKDLG